MTDRIKMSVTFDVTVAQALTLQAMFEHWNRLAVVGASRTVGFYVDGDGNFKPKCKWKFSKNVPELTDEMREAAIRRQNRHDEFDKDFDFDNVAVLLRVEEMRPLVTPADEYHQKALGPDTPLRTEEVKKSKKSRGQERGVDGLTGGIPGLF